MYADLMGNHKNYGIKSPWDNNVKKDEKLQAEAKQQFFEYGQKIGTREVFLDYIWNVVFAASMGYSLKIFNLNYIAWLFN